jgi:hypothetical protein
MVMSMFPMVKTADQLAQEESEKIRQEEEQKKKDEDNKLSTLAAYIKTTWDKNKVAKQTIASEMIESVRQRNMEYSPQKLADIKKIRSSEVYMGLTNTKCRSAEAWICDINSNPSQRPWDAECTPDPEIPKEMESEIQQKFYQEAFYQLLMNSMTSGQATDIATIMEQAKSMAPEFEKRLKKLIYDKAMEAAKEMAKDIDDKLIEGGFYEALDQCTWDIVTLKAAFLKGPIPRMETVRTLKTNPSNGMFEVQLERKVVLRYDRVAPFDMFPSPGSTGINKGDLIERKYFRPSELDSLISIPGYNEKEILAVLQENKEGKLKDWETDIDQERIEQEQQQKDTSTITDLETIPCLEWWGETTGQRLIDWGLKDKSGKLIEPDRIYHAIAWLINTHVIKATINPDPRGDKPYSKASFEQYPNSFWGRGIPELIKDIQAICNACARAIVNNVGIASGPQVEANKDRFPADFDFTLWGWKVWMSTESQMGSDKPALQFYQPPMVVDKLINVYMTFSKLADEYIVPAYSHGDPNVGGAGNTASGLSMLLGGSARMIKDVVKHMDMYLIGPTVERQFYWNIEHKPRRGVIGDIRIVTKGSSYLAVKQEQAIRLMEFARNTVNPIDYPLQGPDGRRYVLKSAAQALNIDADKAFPEQLSGPLQPMQALPPGNNQPAPENLDAAGNPVKGTDTRRFNEGKR